MKIQWLLLFGVGNIQLLMSRSVKKGVRKRVAAIELNF